MADLTKLGAQSFSFRNFDLQGAINCLKELGLRQMEFCGVHFPADPNCPDLAAVRDALAGAGVVMPCFGVEGFSADEAANRARFDFAKAMGAGILTADPAPDSFDSLDALCEEYQIKIAIHNHGPESRYNKISDVARAVEGRHPFIGACVDTGHFIRGGEVPHEAITALGARVHSLHLKDWEADGDEQVLGEGKLDLAQVAAALRAIDFDGPIMMEYELDADGPVPGMQRGLDNWRQASGT